MDWITDHAPWLGIVIVAFIKLIQDHFMIKDHSERIKDLEGKVRNADIARASMASDIKHIRLTTDAMAKKQGVQDDDIKDILRNRSAGGNE